MTSPTLRLSGTNPTRPVRFNAGMTLIELMLVMGLIAVMMGMGLGAFATLDPGRRAALGQVTSLLRTAHNTAVALGAPSRVILNHETGEILTVGMRVVGTWHFEDETLSGSDGIDGVFLGSGSLLDDDGFMGRGLSFDGAPAGARAEFPVQHDPAFDLTEGFSLEISYKPERMVGAKLIEIGDSFLLQATSGGGLSATLYRREVDALGQPRRGARVGVQTSATALRPDQWNHVRCVYDKRTLRLLVNGVPLASTASDVPVWDVEAPLIVGGGTTLPSGVLDRLILAVVVGSERGVLPLGVDFTPQTPASVEFMAGGGLDPTVHLRPVELGLDFGEGGVETIRVNVYGTVE